MVSCLFMYNASEQTERTQGLLSTQTLASEVLATGASGTFCLNDCFMDSACTNIDDKIQ